MATQPVEQSTGFPFKLAAIEQEIRDYVAAETQPVSSSQAPLEPIVTIRTGLSQKEVNRAISGLLGSFSSAETAPFDMVLNGMNYAISTLRSGVIKDERIETPNPKDTKAQRVIGILGKSNVVGLQAMVNRLNAENRQFLHTDEDLLEALRAQNDIYTARKNSNLRTVGGFIKAVITTIRSKKWPRIKQN